MKGKIKDYDPRYDYGGKGDFSRHDKKMYERMGKTILRKKIEEKPGVDIPKFWHGTEPSEEYRKKYEEGKNILTDFIMPSAEAAGKQEETISEYKPNIFERVAQFHRIFQRGAENVLQRVIEKDIPTYLEEGQAAMKLFGIRPDVALGFKEDITPEELNLTQQRWADVIRGSYKIDEKVGALPYAFNYGVQFLTEAAGDLLDMGTRPSTYIAWGVLERTIPKVAMAAFRKLPKGIQQTLLKERSLWGRKPIELAYKELGLKSGAKFSDVEKVYRANTMKFHPDRAPAGQAVNYTRKFINSQAAYEKIKSATTIIRKAEKLGKGVLAHKAQVPIPFEKGDVVRFGKDIGKIISIEGTKALLNIAGKEISASLSQLTPKDAPTPQITPKKGIVEPVTEPLIEEAKKYKTAEEFVEKQPIVYHGTPAQFETFDKKFIGKSEAVDAKLGTFFVSDKEVARAYAEVEEEGKGFIKEAIVDTSEFKVVDLLEKSEKAQKYYTGVVEPLAKKVETIESKIDKTTNEDTLDVLDKQLDRATDKLVNAQEKFMDITEEINKEGKIAKKEGYEGVVIKNVYISPTEDIHKISDVTVAFDVKSIVTKSQLTDIWEKAQVEVKPPEIPVKGVPKTIGKEPPVIPPKDIIGLEGPEGEGGETVAQYEKQKDIWIGKKDVRVLQSKIEKRTLQKEIPLALGKTKYDIETKKYDRAIQLYIDTQRNPEHIAKYYDKLTPEQKQTVNLSQNLPDSVKVIADKISASYQQTGLEALETDVIRNVLDNYTARVWDIEGKAASEKFRKFGIKTQHAKKRKLGTIIEGWANGLNLKVEGATSNLQILKEEIVKTIEDKKFLKSLQKIKTIDGEPLLSTRQLEGYKKVEHPNFKVWRHAGKAPEIEATGRVYGKNFFRDEEGNLFEKRDLYAPESQAKNLNNILGISKLKGIPGVDFATKWNAVVKAWILQSSFFHHLAFMRSYYFGTNHKVWNEMSVRQAYRQGVKAVENENPIVMLGVKNGLTLGLKQDWDEELLRETSKLDSYLDRNKIVGTVKDKVLGLRRKHVDFLFGEFGAGLKAKSFIIEFRNLTKKYPDKPSDEIAKMVANLINDDFGGLHLQRMGRNPTVQHVFRLFALAPDWTESNVRTMIKAFKAGSKEETKFYRNFWAGIFAKGAILTVLGNALMAGLDEDTKEAKGWYRRMIRNYKTAWRNGRMRWMDIDITALYKILGGKTDNRKYFSVLGHFKDPIKFVTHPVRSAHHKGSIVYGVLHEALTGVDWAGRRFTTTPELLGIDKEKGRYKTTRRGYYKKGDPKWGKLKGKTVTWDFRGKGSLNYTQVLSYALSQMAGATPVQIQNLMAWLAGEMEGFDALLKSGGLRVSTTYDKPKKKEKKGSKWKVN